MNFVASVIFRGLTSILRIIRYSSHHLEGFKQGALNSVAMESESNYGLKT